MSDPRRRDTAWFLAIALPLSWALGTAWVLLPRYAWLTQYMMNAPGVVGVACAWRFDREPPRAAGFEYTGAGPWLFALMYPTMMALAAVSIAYGVRGVGGVPDFIFFQPESVARVVPLAGRIVGLHVLGPWLALNLFLVLVYLVIALVYRVPYMGRPATRSGRGWLRHAAGFGLFAALAFVRGGPPGDFGEELGWRGYLVRRWRRSPIVALTIGMPVWAAFHLPIIFAETQRGHIAQNIVFLVSIAAAAPIFAALYLWSGSVWPCAVLHLTWNLWNPLWLGDVYHGSPGFFGGAVWFFNGEGACGAIVNGVVSLFLLRKAARQTAASTSAGLNSFT